MAASAASVGLVPAAHRPKERRVAGAAAVPCLGIAIAASTMLWMVIGSVMLLMGV